MKAAWRLERVRQFQDFGSGSQLCLQVGQYEDVFTGFEGFGLNLNLLAAGSTSNLSPLHEVKILSEIGGRHVFAQYDPIERRQEALLLVDCGKSALSSRSRCPTNGSVFGRD
jgi:hypothetical protein